jgi:hypothetical protein
MLLRLCSLCVSVLAALSFYPMAPDVIKAFEIAGGILLAVFVLIVLVSVVAVNRGTAQLSEHTGERRH